eukprot:scaffold647863_cov40-Prasinocladus_malaysianus.AAC.4
MLSAPRLVVKASVIVREVVVERSKLLIPSIESEESGYTYNARARCQRTTMMSTQRTGAASFRRFIYTYRKTGLRKTGGDAAQSAGGTFK